MELALYQIDAFTNKVFSGNPAAVCPLDSWLETSLMQAISQENNLSETAFFVANSNGYDIRWFTPNTEVEFCGHATLAAAYVLFECLAYALDSITFNSQIGELQVSRVSDQPASFKMDFPALELKPYTIDETLIDALGLEPKEAWLGDDLIIVLASDHEVVTFPANIQLLKNLPGRAVCITAESSATSNYDFVSRFFAPKAGIDEDPVTGSSFCALAPYWGKKLNKKIVNARQVSLRGGDVVCELENDRVILRGSAVKYMQATIYI